MKICRLFLMLAVLVAAGSRELRAQAGAVAGTLGFKPSALLADPVRPRVYAAVPASNGVSVIDTTTLTVTTTAYTGSGPAALAISPDGGTLYVLNTGSTVTAVGVLDLNTLQVRPGVKLPGTPTAIAAGAGGRVFAFVPGSDTTVPPYRTNSLFQIDAATNVIQADLAAIDPSLFSPLQSSPDGRTLYVPGGTGVRSFDVSTPTPNELPGAIAPGADPTEGSFLCSPDGRFFAFTDAYQNNTNPIRGLSVYDPAASTTVPALFEQGSNGPPQAAFSADGTLLYELAGNYAQGHRVETFDLGTMTRTAADIPVPTPIFSYYGVDSYLFAVDNTGSYFFVDQSDGDPRPKNAQDLVVILKTGRGTLQPPVPLPGVTASAVAPSVSYQAGQDGAFVLERTGGLSQPLTVRYKFGGTAEDGLDFNVLSGGRRIIKAGHRKGTIHLHSRGPDYGDSKTVKLTVLADPFYTVGQPAKAKIVLNR